MYNDISKFAEGFSDGLVHGKGVERSYARYTCEKYGYIAYCVSDSKISEVEGPRLVTPSNFVGPVTPDIQFWGGEDGKFWVDVKAKTGLTLYKKNGQTQTGVDVRLFDEYVRFQQLTGEKVYIVHISAGRPTVDSPATTPGIFSASVSELNTFHDHVGYSKGKSLYYWNIQLFERIGTPEDALMLLFGVPYDPERLIHYPYPNEPLREEKMSDAEYLNILAMELI